MAYRSILSVWDGKNSSLPAFHKAIELAQKADGHLHIICPAYITIPSHDGFPYSEIPNSLNISEREQALEKIETLKPEAEKIAKKGGISYSIESPIINRDQLGSFMSNAAKFCDLTVLAQPFGQDRGTADEKMTEGTLMSSDCPILIIPCETEVKELKILIAWDGGQESLRAVRAAMPFLRNADSVDVLTISNNNKTNTAAEIAAELGVFLSRHRIKSNINILAKTLPKISDDIRTFANDLNANLIVMGGYSHSPLREFFFGGPTRDMMHDCNTPTLMAH